MGPTTPAHSLRRLSYDCIISTNKYIQYNIIAQNPVVPMLTKQTGAIVYNRELSRQDNWYSYKFVKQLKLFFFCCGTLMLTAVLFAV